VTGAIAEKNGAYDLSDELIIIGWAYGLGEAAVVVSSLDAAGIHVLAHSRQMASVSWHWTHALGGVALCVPCSQAAIAHEILAEIEPSGSGRRNVARALLAVFVFLWFGVPPPPSGFFLAHRTLSVRAVLEAESKRKDGH
jgi:hypothetical protein